jgi:hypothetical protein
VSKIETFLNQGDTFEARGYRFLNKNVWEDKRTNGDNNNKRQSSKDSTRQDIRQDNHKTSRQANRKRTQSQIQTNQKVRSITNEDKRRRKRQLQNKTTKPPVHPARGAWSGCAEIRSVFYKAKLIHETTTKQVQDQHKTVTR